jgi:hypothetical protein
VEAALDRFQAANTQVLGVSIDSVYCHAAWAASLGGISFPLLADFHPKGELATKLGLYLDGAGITDRATVIIDSDGVVQYVEAVGPGGQRDIGELAAKCEEIDKASSAKTDAFGSSAGLPAGCALYVRDDCGASRAVLLATDNLHATGSLSTKNVSQDSAAAAALDKASGGKQAPCLVVGGEAMLESAAIVSYLVDKCGTPLG